MRVNKTDDWWVRIAKRRIRDLSVYLTQPADYAMARTYWLARAVLGVAAAIVVAGLLVLLLGPVAEWANPGDHLPGKERADALTATRQTLLAAAGGAAILGGLGFTVRTYYLTRRGQFTDRYAKAVALLASDTLTERLSGIYSLEHLMRESARDHHPVVEILAAHVRERSPARTPEETAVRRAGSLARYVVFGETPRPAPRVDVEIQAVLTVLGRRPLRPAPGPVNLAGTDLRGADLENARLDHAVLAGARLDFAKLGGCQLAGADLTGASLRGAYLWEADLTVAKLEGADLSYAFMDSADLSMARLSDADLTGASLREADLDRVWFAGAELHAADLTGAKLSRFFWSDPPHVTRATTLPEPFRSEFPLDQRDELPRDRPGAPAERMYGRAKAVWARWRTRRAQDDARVTPHLS